MAKKSRKREDFAQVAHRTVAETIARGERAEGQSTLTVDPVEITPETHDRHVKASDSSKTRWGITVG